MKFTLDNGNADYRITAYESGHIRINEQIVAQSVIVSPNETCLWPPGSMDALTEADLQDLLAYEPEILILGTGLRQCFPDSQLLRPLIQAGIGLEVMDSAAACRTYNILMSEERQVVAAIIVENPQ